MCRILMTVSDQAAVGSAPKKAQKSKGLKGFMRLAGGLWQWALRDSWVGMMPGGRSPSDATAGPEKHHRREQVSHALWRRIGRFAGVLYVRPILCESPAINPQRLR